VSRRKSDAFNRRCRVTDIRSLRSV